MKLRFLVLTAILAASCQSPNDVGAKDTSHTQGPPSGFAYSSANLNLTVGVAASVTPPTTSSGAPVTHYSISPSTVPAGLTFDTTTGIFSGTPTALTPEVEYIVTAYNGYGSRFVRIFLAIVDVTPLMTYGGATTQTFHVGNAITTITPTLTGGPLTGCTVNPALPTGLSLSSQCVISGTPTVAETSVVHTVTAENSGGASALVFTFTVTDNVPAFSYAGPNTLTRGAVMTALTPTSTGGVITSCSSAPALPPGLALSSTCVISGTPTTVTGSAAYTITATNNGGNSTANVTIAVVDILPVISYAGGPFVYTKGSVITALSVTNTGGVINSCAIAPALPAGLALSVTTCQITGTPTAVAAAANYTVTATNAAGPAVTTLNITVKDIPPTIAYAASPYTFSNLTAITPVTATLGGGTVTGCSSSPTLPSGLSISSICTISGTPASASAAANYVITATNSGGSANVTINIRVQEISPVLTYTGSPFTYTKNTPLTPLTANNAGGPITSCSANVALPPGLALSSTCTISGLPTTPIAAANYVITGTNVAGSSSTTINITVIDSAPSISYAGSPFTYTKNQLIATLSATNAGGTITGCSSAPALPTGLSIAATTCAISGTPTTVTAAANYVITATNSGGTSQATINITVNDVAPILTYASAPFTFTKNTAIASQTPTNTGGTVVSCTVLPALPAGLSLSATCVLSGTPTAITSSTNYTITGTNTGGSNNTSINIIVNDAAPAITYAGSPFTYNKGTAITNLVPTNTGGTIVSCSSAPAVPAGLSLSATCVLSGIPTTQTAAANYIITAVNTGGSSNRTINITVTDSAPSITYTGSPFVYTKSVAITTLAANNAGGAITGCSSAPALPAGLAISATTCNISGTPTTITAAANYTITATNAGGSSNTTINITIKDAIPVVSYVGSPFTYTKNTAITTLSVVNSGGTITGCTSAPALPAGLAISATCQITGTPTAITAAAAHVITATNTGGSANTTITMTVNDAVPTLSYSTVTFIFDKNSAITAVTPTTGGGAITSCSSSPPLPVGLSISSTCVITGTPTAVTAEDTYLITATNTGGSASATLDITVADLPPAITYAGSPFTYSSGVAISTLTPTNTGGSISSCSSSPTLPSGLSVSNLCVITGTPSAGSAATTYTITAVNSGGSNSASIVIAVNDIAPAIAYTGGPYTYTKNTAISTLNANSTGGGITSCASAPPLPAGLIINTGTCGITGTPTAITGTASYTITATNGVGTSQDTISITVNDAVPAFSYTPASNIYTIRTAITALNATSTGGAIIGCSPSPALPAGLTLSATCGITGTPTVWSAATLYTITATNTGGSSQATVTFRVKDQAEIVFYGKTALDGSNDGSAPSSKNAWKVALDGVKVALTSNSNASLDTLSPSWLATGAKVVHSSLRATDGSTDGTSSLSYNIWTMQASGSGPSALTANTLAGLDSDDPPVYSPSGAKIVFASKTDLSGSADGTATGSYNIWIMNANGTGKAHLTGNSNASLDSHSPVFSPDGVWVYFSSLTATDGSDDGTASTSYNIWKVKTDGTSRTVLTAPGGAGQDSLTPSVSPDGSQVVFTSLMDGGGGPPSSYGIWVMNNDGSSATALVYNAGIGLDSKSPSFSHDGTLIVFASLMDVNAASTTSYNVWTMTAAGGSQTALTTNNGANQDSLNPSFVTDDSKIVFHSRQDTTGAASSFNVWLMNANGTSQSYLTNNRNAGLDSYVAPQGVWYKEP